MPGSQALARERPEDAGLAGSTCLILTIRFRAFHSEDPHKASEVRGLRAAAAVAKAETKFPAASKGKITCRITTVVNQVEV
jgi:hypothetical protein